jgi:hypothetical protein
VKNIQRLASHLAALHLDSPEVREHGASQLDAAMFERPVLEVALREVGEAPSLENIDTLRAAIAAEIKEMV